MSKNEWFSNLGHQLSPGVLKAASRDVQREELFHWFHRNFEDPAERTPYESAEGGYIWIWGGPYEAEEELRAEFEGMVPDDLIQEVVYELEGESWDWAPTGERTELEEYYRGALSADEDPFRTFEERIGNLWELLDAIDEADLRNSLYQMIYVAAVTAMEAYLSDRFSQLIFGDRALYRRFIETSPQFREQKIPVARIFEIQDSLEDLVKSYLAGIVWHRLEQVIQIYKGTMRSRLEFDIGPIKRIIEKRHDLVHRAGRTKQGDVIVFDRGHLADALRQVEEFVCAVETGIDSAASGDEQPPA